jgi:hypothetical protein
MHSSMGWKTRNWSSISSWVATGRSTRPSSYRRRIRKPDHEPGRKKWLRVPMRTQPSQAERRRDGPPACWHCENVEPSTPENLWPSPGLTSSQDSPRGRRVGHAICRWRPGRPSPAFNEALVQLTLRRSALHIWVFVAEITDEFLLGQDVLRANDASVDLWRHVLRLGCKQVSLWSPGARPRPSPLTLASDEAIPAR